MARLFFLCSWLQRRYLSLQSTTSANSQPYNISELERILSSTDSLSGGPFPAGAGNNACFSDMLISEVFKCEYQSRIVYLELLHQ
ncbi:hypothetical protein DPMN_066073 [Dreissena polymorpha]|uniref:Uncharacterized protein n=1 Tax=Dreissena polymorpha TaxID=45954 RepID=A0A9D4BRR9_DREPO|nr:hypothetical protein DPMN_066073 [Dreissena polymorpha]